MFTGFEPDPDISDPEDEYFGTGTWTYDDGTSMYGQGDPEEARRLFKPPAPGQGAIDAGAPRADFPNPSAAASRSTEADVGPPPMIARPPETVSTPVDGANGSRPADETPGIRIPRASRIAWVHNNPGNLKFVGQEGAQQGEPAEDGGHFAAFETPEEGVAALQRQIQLDAGRGKTLREFISKYAPPGSNNTPVYLQQASDALGGDLEVKLSDLPLDRVTAFMARKESGTELGATSLPEQAPPLRAPGSSLPSSLGGMPAAMAEVRGAPLSLEQLQQRQQGVYDSTMTQVAGVQSAAEARQQGREESLKLVTDQHQRFVNDQQAQIAKAAATRAEAERNVQTAMATQLDPGRAIKGMSTGDLVLGAVALMVGGLGQTLQQRGGQRGAGNAALATLEKALADDLEAQKDDKKSRVAHWTRVFNDADMGVKAARAELYNAAGRYAEYQAQHRAQNADIQAQMLQDSATLIAKGQAEANALVDRENERLSVRYQVPPPPKGGPGALEGVPRIARVGVEDKDPETREALANAYNPDSAADRGQMNALTREMQEITKLEQTLDGLMQWYGVGTDKENYDSSATGPWWNPGNWADNDQKDRELRDLWSRVETDTRSGWKAEPNGEAVQIRLSGINSPKRDAEAPTKLAELQAEIERRKEAIMSGTNAPVRAAWKYQNGYPLETSKGGRPVTGRIAR